MLCLIHLSLQLNNKQYYSIATSTYLNLISDLAKSFKDNITDHQEEVFNKVLDELLTSNSVSSNILLHKIINEEKERLISNGININYLNKENIYFKLNKQSCYCYMCGEEGNLYKNN